MSSEESDDEPLAVIACLKKRHRTEFPEVVDETTSVPAKKQKENKFNTPASTKLAKISPKLKDIISPPVIQRPEDVWMYLKDFNTTGPYSCLLCSEFFINRSKIIVHYILNHKKDFCGICRYFVPDREAWTTHAQFHVPWKCSQCDDEFSTDEELRDHFSKEHGLVHCRLCHFRMPDNDEYNRHLYEKHNVTNASSKNVDTLWEVEYDGCPKFLCLLCSKSNNQSLHFYNHYMCYHRFTLRCFSKIISGLDIPYSVCGANISVEFLANQLKDQDKFGYVDYDLKPPVPNDNEQTPEMEGSLDALVPEIKQEQLSDSEEPKKVSQKKKTKDDDDDGNGIWNTYKGVEDFDITSTEIMTIQTCYYDYVNELKTNIASEIVPVNSEIDYENAKSETPQETTCPMCFYKFRTTDFNLHMSRMHGIKVVPAYFCRVCATTFETLSELTLHVAQELGEFENLWICQFCDCEFDSREATRKHLNEHWQVMELENCFSPHLGFKCRYCPTLFWNEPDREGHQKRVHFTMHTEDFYKCESCSELFSDKVWFIHHYLDKHLSEDVKPLHLLKCCLCALVVPNVDEMRTHFASEHAEARKTFCSLEACSFKPFAHKKSFKFHLKAVHKPKARDVKTKVSCQICGREFESSRACSCHMAQVHGPGRFKCKLCHAFLNNVDERKLHYLLAHPGRHPFECTTCGKSFPYKSSLYSHKLEHKPDRSAFTCGYCGKTFLKKDSYREHVLIHEGPRHACSYCPMRFVQRSNMLRHERRHTGERPYTCHYCPAAFSDKGACNSHMRTHSKVESHPCMYCGQTFVQKSKLKYHMRKHTGLNLETCPVCAKLFTSAYALREHMRIHAKNKYAKVACPMCKKFFQDESYIIRHIRSAHNKDGFSCPICPKKLSSSVSLRQHVITHSKLRTFKCKVCPKSFAVKRSLMKHIPRRHPTALKACSDDIEALSQTLDARECQLGLDEDMLTYIFGPPKNINDDVVLKEVVTFPHEVITGDRSGDESKSDKGDDKTESSDDDDDDTDKAMDIKVEPDSEPETELEPTDFVSVKIEPFDEYEARKCAK